jgi:hypothetical protein
VTACNQRPPAEHPFHASLVACHMPAGHEGPHTWEGEPSLARRGLDKLLEAFWFREIESVDSQPGLPIVVRDIVTDEQSMSWAPGPSGPWVIVTFVGADQFAIWKETGAVYRVGADGAVQDEPILLVA